MDTMVIVIVQCFEELLVHQRSKDKETFSELYGLGAGGKVEENLHFLTSFIKLFRNFA